MAKQREEYNAKSIEVVQNVAHVRRRPNMYIHDTGPSGLLQCLKECIDNSVDEWLSGQATRVKITIIDELTFEVEDNGRGIPVDKHPKTQKPALTSIFTLLGAGGKFSKKSYKLSAGLHGMGVTVVNALATQLDVWTRRDGAVWHQQFLRGKVNTKLAKVKDRPLKKGTIVRAVLDTRIFKKARLVDEHVFSMAQTISFLCPGLTVDFTDTKGKLTTWCSDEGLEGLLKTKHGDDLNIGPVTIISEYVDVTFGWKFESDGENWHGYVNVSPTPDGGTHVEGAKLGISLALQKWSKGSGLSGKDLREGLVGVIHVLEPEPQFVSQAKVKLSGEEVKTKVREEVAEQAFKWFKKNIKSVKEVVARAKQIREAKAEYRKARSTLNKIAKGSRGTLPAKLKQSANCPPQKRELFIVEGDSAGGTAKAARDPKYQEVLPLRGKMPNSERTALAKLLENEEMQNILRSIGGGFGPDFDLAKMRVGKVMLLMDADPDGAHIVSLMLTFFIKYMPALLRAGKLYIVESPLFVGKHGTKTWYGDALKDVKKHPKAVITRLKGHGGSNPEGLWHYAFSNNRKLIRVTMKRAKRALSIMGDEVAVRKTLLGLDNENGSSSSN